MLSQPLVLAPLFALLVALGWVAGRARRQRRELVARVALLEQTLATQRAEVERSEAARAQAEAGLRSAEQRFLLAVRGSQDGLWEWELATGTVQLSPRWKGMLGYETDALPDSLPAWRDCMHPDDRAGFEAALQRHLEGATPHVDEALRLRHRDGSVRHVLSRAVAIRRESGAPYRVVGLDTDVTALRRVQAVLDAVADGTAATSGAGFFDALVEHFARALEVECAFITECADAPPTRVRTLGYWSARRGTRESFEFDLAGTPCEEVVQQGRTCFHRERLATLFPREAGYESYLGMPITGSDGRVLGHLAIFDTRPRGDDLLMERIYRIFLARAAAEIERCQALQR
ncbi:PAS domain-containing protein [uncultured Piscinibacter sp.]|uniref:PAS domain-containing protein n=1 Tax=uncultured Piscinibacter sp. TaxID=1131835 RepID=UPI002637240F|nr:PAS domain-containing protein [uncultured Piscinibacter sp.]